MYGLVIASRTIADPPSVVPISLPTTAGSDSTGSFPSSPKTIPRTPFSPYKAPKRPVQFRFVEAALGRTILTPEQFSNEWLFGYQHAQHFVLYLTEAGIHRQWPVAPVAEELMYLKSHVLIAGTVDSPETFTTNIGKLVTQDTGESYPTFSSATHVFKVSIESYNDRLTFKYTQPTVSGGNLTFQVSASDAGALLDNCYADITVWLQDKP